MGWLLLAGVAVWYFFIREEEAAVVDGGGDPPSGGRDLGDGFGGDQPWREPPQEPPTVSKDDFVRQKEKGGYGSDADSGDSAGGAELSGVRTFPKLVAPTAITPVAHASCTRTVEYVMNQGIPTPPAPPSVGNPAGKTTSSPKTAKVTPKKPVYKAPAKKPGRTAAPAPTTRSGGKKLPTVSNKKPTFGPGGPK